MITIIQNVPVYEQMLKFTVIMKAYREAGFTGAVMNQGNVRKGV